MTRFPVVLSAPSGAGKTTIARRLMAERADVGYSVSATTRPPRPGEVDGVDYHFLSDEEFIARQRGGEFAESAVVHGRWYGTLRREVQRVLDSGRHVIMDIDVQGAAQFAATFPDSLLLFILPPSVEALVDRLRARNTESDTELAARLRNAHDELRQVGNYHQVIVNDDLGQAVADVSLAIDREDRNRAQVVTLDGQVSRLISRLEDQIARFTT